MSEPTSREGTQFGPYRLLRLIGKGGMGEVYEAEDTKRDRIVALKLLPETISHDPVFRKRLQREAHSAGRLQEPHVVPIHDYGEIDGVLFVDMRMINGSDLRKLLRTGGPMPPARAVALVRQVASALDAAHEAGIQHRDIKPENILVNKEDFAYLVDFGIANAKSDEKLTELGTAVGTYAYMAPERFSSGEVTYRADIYALACVLHECLTGQQPYTGDSVSVVITGHLMNPVPRPSAQRGGIPAGFDHVIARGMAKNPEDRYNTAGELAMAANAALTEADKGTAETIVQRSALGLDQGATMMAPIATPPPMSAPPHGSVPPPPSYPPPAATVTPPPGGGYPSVPHGATPTSFPTHTPGSYPAAPSGPYPTNTPGSYPSAPSTPSGQYGYAATPPPPPPGAPQFTSGGGGKPPGKKVPWVPIAAVAAVVVIVATAIGVAVGMSGDDEDPKASGDDTTSSRTTSSRTRTTTTTEDDPTPTSTQASSSAADQLMANIPAGYPTSVCEVVDTQPDALVTIDCKKSVQPDGPTSARYSLFANRDLLQSSFDALIGEYDEVVVCPGSDESPSDDWYFKSAPDVPAGRIACGYYEGRADIQWSEFTDLVLADIQSDNLDSLRNWWLNYS